MTESGLTLSIIVGCTAWVSCLRSSFAVLLPERKNVQNSVDLFMKKKHNARYDVVSMSVIIRHGFDKTVSETMLNIAITTSTNETSCILGLAIGLYLPESIFW